MRNSVEQKLYASLQRFVNVEIKTDSYVIKNVPTVYFRSDFVARCLLLRQVKMLFRLYKRFCIILFFSGFVDIWLF